MKGEFERVTGSLLGGEMVLSCGYNNTFKIASGMLGRPVLYWKSGIEWQKLEDATFKDAGAMFRGLGIQGGVPLKELALDIDLPIFNTGSRHNRKTKRDYFIKSQEGDIVPYEYSLDVVQGRLTSTNMLPITDRVRLDVEKYTEEQSSLGMSMAYTEEQKIQEEAKKREREAAVKAAVEQFDRDFEVVTPARKHQLTQYCNLDQ